MEEEIFKIYHKGPKVTWEVSNYGNVKRNNEPYQPKIHCGYYYFGNTLLHRAVAELFIPNPDNKPCVDHIDTNKLNNRADNLRWVTYSENNLNPITRKRISEVQKGRQHSDETKAKMSKAHKGKVLSVESKNKNSVWHQGKHLSEETKAKISAAHKGKNHSEESKAKISASLKGRSWFLGSDGKRHWI